MLPAMPGDKHRQTLVMCQVQLGDQKWNFLVCLCMPPRTHTEAVLSMDCAN